MSQKTQKIEKEVKYTLLLSTLGLSIYAILALNLLLITLNISELINEIDFDKISITFIDGFYALNGKKIGVSIFYNIIMLFIIWFLMILHTLKVIKKPITYIYT
ncbi:hypothetical protein [Flavobacterium sp.]|uniref:hypothetical protein n=1 Tax=Flavobacterium sp. TaxID=239 RepID=UPI00286E861B|nr:hypothetical protein [Flavobacterium sp.]